MPSAGKPRRRSRRRASRSRALVDCRSARDRLDLRRHRVEQPGDQGRGAVSTRTRASTSITVKTEHKAVLDTMRELERDGFEVTYLDVEADGLLDLAQVRGGAAPGHDPRLGDVREQRDRRHPGHRRPSARSAARAASSSTSMRRRPPARCAIDLADAEGRPDVVLGAQDLRAEGHRRAVRAAQAARAHRSADARRRPRARHALGHAADAPDRRHGRGLPPGARWRWPPTTSASAGCATGCWQGLSRHRGGVRQRRPGAARAAQPQRQLQLRRGRDR